MGGRTRQTTTSTTTNSLPAGQQQNVDLLMQGARDQFATGGPRAFQGPTVVGADPLQTQARAGATGYAGGAGQDFVTRYLGGERTFLDPNNIFNPSNIPGFQQAQQGVTQLATQNLMEQVLPRINAGAITAGTGALGGSRQQMATALAAGRANEGLQRTLADMNMNAYSAGLGMYNSAASRAPTSYGLGLAPTNTMESIGALNRGDAQSALDDQVNRWNFEQMRPVLNLQTLQGLTGTYGQYGGTQNSTQTQQMSGGNTGLTRALGTALSLASLIPGPHQAALLGAGTAIGKG